MQRILVFALVIVLAPGVLAVADPCASLSGGTCAGVVPVVLATDVGPGQVATFDAPAYVIAGLITVRNGGTMLVKGSILDFDGSGAGILVESGGKLTISDHSVLQSSAASVGAAAAYEVVAAAGSTFNMTLSEVHGGTLRLYDPGAIVQRVTFESTPLALDLHNVSTTLLGLKFSQVGNGILIDGGAPTVRQAQFESTENCIEADGATLTIENSEFNECHSGVVARDSTTLMSYSFMMDRQDPASVGALIVGGNAEIHHTQFKDWGIGIRAIDGAVLNEHDNTFVNNDIDVG